MEKLLNTVNSIVWGIPVLLLILTTGIALSIRSRFAQIRFLPAAIRHFMQSLNNNDANNKGTSGYRALCTALAATVGTGNIAGVAGAIAIGGPGVVFWMWICAILGMITKLAEVTLAVHFRHRVNEHEYIGGPMYMIEKGLSSRYHFLAYIYSFFGCVAALGIGNAVQINAVIDAIESVVVNYHGELTLEIKILLGAAISLIIIPIFKKDTAGVGSAAEILVPAAAMVYIILATAVLCIRYQRIPAAFLTIIHGAFTPSAVTGGIITSAFLTLRVGASRGVFTNEAGMGTASIAHASSNVIHPMDQGLMGIMEVFIDTIIICTLTGLVILCSDISIPYSSDHGISLAFAAFAAVLGTWSNIVLTGLICIFAFATILGWGLYGIRCCQYLLGPKFLNCYIYGQSFSVILGSVLSTPVVWVFAETVNGLMAIPNLIAVSALSGVFIRILKEYQEKENAYRPK